MTAPAIGLILTGMLSGFILGRGITNFQFFQLFDNDAIRIRDGRINVPNMGYLKKARGKGAQICFTESKRVTVPFHTSKILHPKGLKRILADAGLTAEEFTQLLKES